MLTLKHFKSSEESQKNEMEPQNMRNTVLETPPLKNIVRRERKQWKDYDFIIQGNMIRIERDGFENQKVTIDLWNKALKYVNVHGWANIKKLEFSIWIDLTNNFVRAINSGICKNMTNLRQLDLSFNDAVNVTSQEAVNLVTCLARNLPQLQDLSLYFWHIKKFTNKAFVTIGSEISNHMINLRYLRLSLSKCKLLTEDGLQAFCSKFRGRMQNLEKFSLLFSQTPSINDKWLEIIGSSIIRYLPPLKTLAFSFSDCEETITGQGVQTLVQEIFKCQTQLERLRLNFARCMEVNDQGLTAFVSESNKPLANLKSLNLNFELWWITDSGLETFAENFARSFPNLERLILDLKEEEEITNQGLSALITCLSKDLPNLESLHINFERCPKITDEIFDTFSTALVQHFPSLTGLTLSFWTIGKKDSFEAVENLAISLSQNQVKLQDLFLFLNIPDGKKRRLQELLSFIPRLYV